MAKKYTPETLVASGLKQVTAGDGSTWYQSKNWQSQLSFYQLQDDGTLSQPSLRLPGGFAANPASAGSAAPTTGTQTRGYVPTADTKESAKTAVLMQEAVDAKSRASGGTGSGGSGSGMLSDNQPLGATLDEENRYLRRGGAVLLR